MKKLNEMTIKDNFMFGAVMSDEANCKRFLEMVLGIPIKSLRVEKEKSMLWHPEYKGVRLDVLADDEVGTRYNVEMQVKKDPDLGLRSRYYHSQIDADLISAGTRYRELPGVYVIFICDFDPVGKKLYRYSFHNSLREDKSVEMDDRQETIYLSTAGRNRDEVPAELISFLEFVHANHPQSEEFQDDAFVSQLQESIRKIKADREMGEKFMTFEEFVQDEREEAFEKGLEEGSADTYRKILRYILTQKGEVKADLQKMLQEETDSSKLEEWFNLAIASTDIADFEAKIR